MTAQRIESPFRIIDDTEEIWFGVTRTIASKPETNAVSRNRILEFGGQLSRTAAVECILYIVSRDEEVFAEENTLLPPQNGMKKTLTANRNVSSGTPILGSRKHTYHRNIISDSIQRVTCNR
jgi:hypothetical protein